MLSDKRRLSTLAAVLTVVLAGCGGLSGQTTQTQTPSATQTQTPPATQTQTPSATQTPTATQTEPPARGGLLVVAPVSTPEAAATVIAYEPERFGEVPSLNRSVTAAAASNDSVTVDLSPSERDAVEGFLAAECEGTSDCVVRVDGTTVEVSVAVEA